MRILSLTLLSLAAMGAQAGTAYLDLSPQSPTTVPVGGTVSFLVEFRQYQENWSFDNGAGEPSPDIGFQTWQSYFYESWHDTLTALKLQVGPVGGVPLEHSLQPGALPGTDYSTTWLVSLPFSQPGSYTVRAGAQITQDKDLRRGATVGTRECVGFENSVQCDSWSFHDELWEDAAWTELTWAESTAVSVFVVPEPSSLMLWAAAVAGLAGVARVPCRGRG